MTETSVNKIASLTPPRIKAIDYLLSPIFMISFLGVLLLGELFLRLGLALKLKPNRPVIAVVGYAICWLLRLILGTRITVTSHVTLKPGQSYIFVANHQSLFDIPLLQLVSGSRYVHFIAKKELLRWIPTVAINLQSGGHAIIDRSDASQALPAIAAFAKKIDPEARIAVIFPEGTRARDGKLKLFRSAGVNTLLTNAPNAEVIPVAIDGSWRFATRKFGPIPSGQKVHITVGPAVARNSFDDSKRLLAEIRRVIQGRLGQ